MSLPPPYLELGRRVIAELAPECLRLAQRQGAEAARRHALARLDALLASLPMPRSMACARGCAFCCHRPVAASAAEVFALVEYLRANLDDAAFAAFAARCSETAATAAALGRDARARTSLACPALQDGLCSAHPARPLRCRAYNSLDVDACRRFFAAPAPDAAGPRADLDVYVLGQAVMFGLYEALERAGFDNAHYELSSALAEALRDPEAQARYLRGGKAFRVALAHA
jgi:hypothetical protein